MMGLPFRELCNVTHFLLVIGTDVMILPFRILCNVTYFVRLLVIGQDVMRLPFNTCEMSLTPC